MLPALGLIVVNFYHLKSIQRDKVLEAAIHRDLTYFLGIAEGKVNWYASDLAEQASKRFPSPDEPEAERIKKLDAILAENPNFVRVFVFDPKQGITMRSQPGMMSEKWFRDEHVMTSHGYATWFKMESKYLCDTMRKREKSIMWYSNFEDRGEMRQYMASAFFILPNVRPERDVFAGVSIDPGWLQHHFFPNVLDEVIEHKIKKQQKGTNPLAISVFPSEPGEAKGVKLLAASAGWRDTKPEATYKLDDAFRGLTLGIQFQDVTVDELGHRWMERSFMILGVLSLLLFGGLWVTYHAVTKEVALARLKSDFVSNVSHELRTPLALIRLYAETLELGRVQVKEKTQEYYRIIRQESERLTALINNILDFSRIESGRKEYEFRDTDIAGLVKKTIESYRDQIEEQGFALEQQIDGDIPTVQVDQEAIARSVVNLVNNALKYSDKEKFLGVKLYRANGSVKLEVIDHGIGIPRSEQAKIFEKFYRVGDPLVHNTKGSGLGLALVRHIAQAHGGAIVVESAPGKGSKFTLWLPLTDSNAAASHAASGAGRS